MLWVSFWNNLIMRINIGNPSAFVVDRGVFFYLKLCLFNKKVR